MNEQLMPISINNQGIHLMSPIIFKKEKTIYFLDA